MTTSSLRRRLRALPAFGADLTAFDTDALPTDPRDLFLSWLDRAIADGLLAPHAATLSTAGPDGADARTLILKDLDEHGWWFASRTDGSKSRELEVDPRAALTFFWREHGRQVRVRGRVVEAGADASAADFLERPPASRAAALIGIQSTPLESRRSYAEALAVATAELGADPGVTAANWSALILVPQSVEFWAATPADGQVRIEYRLDGDGVGVWRHGLLWP